MGAEARIDFQPSGEWLREATSSWPWPVHIKARLGAACPAPPRPARDLISP